MSPSWNPSQMPNLAGKVAVVTGASKGLGIDTAKHLAVSGAKVYCAARNEAKAMQTRRLLLSENPKIREENLVFLQLDLSNVESVLAAITELKGKEQKIDILINSAGIVSGKEAANGAWDEVMMTCHIGHFIFTNGLFSLLKEAASLAGSDVRVVNVSSNTPNLFFPTNYRFDFSSKSVFNNVVSYYPWRWTYFAKWMFTLDMVRYSMAKLANQLFTKELQKRCDDHSIPILCLSLHPGAVGTSGAEEILKPLLRPLLRLSQITPDQGSYNSLWAATTSEPRLKMNMYKGNYIEPIGVLSPVHPVVHDGAQARGLWDNTTAEANEYLRQRDLPVLPGWI
ncbi:hypothetical protein S40288_04501 [Stachybotrys chartarum IBT 40288]|nr:hypothetical protein S40288_04501 [Stachybotrys chartarum IBT 40288]